VTVRSSSGGGLTSSHVSETASFSSAMTVSRPLPQWTASTYGLQITTADEFRGRIFATDFALVTLTMSVSFTIAGLVAESTGPGPVIAVLAGLSALWATAYLLATRRIRARAATAGALGTIGAVDRP